MTNGIYPLLYIGGAIAAGVMLIVSVLLFFLLHIPAVIGDLSGRTARKAIEDIRNQNEQSGVKTYKSSAVNRSRGKITDKISPSGRLQRRNTSQLTGAMSTAELHNETTVLTAPAASQETMVLDETPYAAQETTLLSGEPMSPPAVMNVGTIPEETTVLSYPEAAPAAETPTPAQPEMYSSVFTVEYDITFIHTNERID